MQSSTADVAARASLQARVGASSLTQTATVSNHTIWLLIILGFAFVLRLAWIAYSDWQPMPDDDAFRYDFTARALLEGQGYVHLNGAPTAFWPPGYPLLLASAYWIFEETVAVAQLLNVLLGTATVGLVYLIGRRTLGMMPALVGAAIVAAFPSLIFFTAVTLSEVTFTFLALLAIYLLVLETQSGRGRQLPLLLAAGLVLGYAVLVRGQALLLPIIFVPFWLRSGVRWPGISHKLVALALGIGLMVAPWSIRNAIQMESPVFLSTNAGINFWIGNHEGATGRGQLADELVYSYPELTTVQREVRVNAEASRRGLAYALTHPVQEVSLSIKKLFWLYYHDSEGLSWNEGHGGQPFLSSLERVALFGLSNIYYFAVLGFFALGVRLWFSLRDPGSVLLISIIVYWTLVHVAFFGDPRFHAPIMPIVALLAAVPIVALWARRTTESRRT